MRRTLWRGRTHSDYLSDALALLSGWHREGQQITRVLELDDAQHAALTERIKIAADALHLRPEIRRRDGRTEIRVGATTAEKITEYEVALAARIEDAFRTVTGHDAGPTSSL
jgi:4a-hydroxytetrahydrobiopterin dehydratase